MTLGGEQGLSKVTLTARLSPPPIWAARLIKLRRSLLPITSDCY